MKESLMEIIVCPICKSDLKLTIEDKKGSEIISGKLSCLKCNQTYQITDGIPNLIPPEIKA